MAIIYSYPNGGSAIASDKLTISRSSLDAPIPNPTFTLTVAQIAAFVQNQLASGTPNYIPVFNTANSIIDSPMFLDDFAAPTLLTIGVDAVMSGGLTVTGASVFNNTSEFWGMTTFEDVASFQNAVYDETSTPGTSGQILSSTGSAARWIDPALTGVGTIGKIPVWVGTDELGDSIMSTLGGNTIEVAGNMTVQGIEVNTTFTDGAGSTGSPGQVLTSTGTETAWVGGSTGTVSGGGTTNTLPLWTDGPNDVIGDSQLNQVGPNANGVYQIRMQNTDRFIIDKPSSVTSGDPEYLITQDGNFKVSMGWDDDGTGFGYLYNWAGDGWRFGSAGNNPELTIVTTAGSEGVDIANDLRVNGNAIAFGDLTIENGLIDGDFTYGTAGQVLSTTGSGQNVKWVDTTTGAFKEVNEGNGLGIVKQSRNPNNYAPVGNEAFDASQSTSVSSTKGAEGDYSVALGLDVYARGDHSFAFGETSRAFNDWDIVMGHDSEAVGGNSVALGWEAKAQGAVSTAIGSFVTASGDNSIAFGTRLTATGSESNVFGKYNATTNELFVVGNGNNSTPSDLIVGKENGVILAPSLDILEIVDPKCLVTLEYISAISSGIIGTGTIGNIPVWTTATSLGNSPIKLGTGTDSLILGAGTLASGDYSTAMGESTEASGEFSTAMGHDTEASGDYSTALGQQTVASGDRSTAMGYNTTASGVGSMAIGFASIAEGISSFAGGGNDDGNVGGKAKGNNSIAFGEFAIASTASFALGNGTKAGVDAGGISTGNGAVAVGNQTHAQGSHSFASGTGSVASGTASTAMGNNCSASADHSFAVGVNCGANGNNSVALGQSSVASGLSSVAIGDEVDATGDFSFAAGKGNQATGDGSIVMGGVGTGVSTASGEASAVFGGLQNNAAGINSTILGGQKNDIDVNSNDSSILGGEDNTITAGSKNSVLLGGIGLRGEGIHQTTCGVANVSRYDAKFVVGVGTYTDPTNITRENGFVVKDDGQIVLDQYRNNDFLDNNKNYEILNIDETGRVKKADLPELLSDIPTKLTVDTGTPLSSGSNINLASDASTVIGFDWAGGPGLGLVTLPQSSNNYGKVITVFTMDGYGSVANTNRLGVKPGFGDSINGVNAPAVAIELDKAYESAEFIATGIGWVLLRSTIL